MTSPSIEERIRSYIVTVLRYTDGLPSDRSLREAGILDSGNVLELVRFLEVEFAISIDDRDLVPENFDTLASLVALVEKRSVS